MQNTFYISIRHLQAYQLLVSLHIEIPIEELIGISFPEKGIVEL